MLTHHDGVAIEVLQGAAALPGERLPRGISCQARAVGPHSLELRRERRVFVRLASWGMSLMVVLLCSAVGRGQAFVTVAAVAAEDPYRAAVRELTERHGGEVLDVDPRDPGAVEGRLRALRPSHVAIVLRPESLDLGVAERWFALACRIDDDPFVDFSWGFVTGASAADAVRLVQAGAAPAKEASVAQLGVWERGGSTEVAGTLRLGKRRFPLIEGRLAEARHFAETGRDVEFLRGFLPRLAGRRVVTFGGHGYPDRVIGGPTAEDIAQAPLSQAFVFNLACFTGVTGTWFDETTSDGMVHRRSIEPERSFALRTLGTGCAAYTAWLCPRPAGPELSCDVAALLTEGLSTGEVRRRDYDKILLGRIAAGKPAFTPRSLEDGGARTAILDPITDAMLAWGTGGVLFGDPMVRPFEADSANAPLRVRTEDSGGRLAVTLEMAAADLALYGMDPTMSLDGEGAVAHKLWARVPIGNRHVTGVTLDGVTRGRTAVPARLVWAVEKDRGEHFVHLKAAFASSTSFRAAVARFRVTLSEIPTGAPGFHADPPLR